MNKHDDLGQKEQDAVMARYRSRGFVKTQQDEDALHMFHSPYRVPNNLTKLTVRRRINHYLKHGNKTKLEDVIGNRLEVRINGKLFLGASFGGKLPKNHKQLHSLLRDLLITVG
jgi:hypothetical protein